MRGLDVLEKLHELDPSVRVAGGARDFPHQPVNRASLLSAVSDALEASA